MGVWYPPNWLFGVGDTLTVYSRLTVMSRLAFLLLAYGFLRTIRLHPYTAAGGAVVMVFCGFRIAWSVHPTFLASSMWLPLALAGLTIGIQRDRRRGLALAGLGLGLSVLGGHAQMALYIWIASGLWAMILVAASLLQRHRDRGRLAATGAGVTAGVFALGAGLASLQILSAQEFTARIIRGAEPYDALVAAALPVGHVMKLFIPDLFGNPVDGNALPGINYTESAAYAGVVALVIPVLAVRRLDRFVAGFGVIGLVGLAPALGIPFYRLLYDAVPGVDRTRAIGRIVLLVDVAIACLAAIGVDRLIRARPPRWSILAAAGAVAAGVLVAAWTGPGLAPGYLAPRVALALVFVSAGAGLALLVPRRPAAALGLVALQAVDLWRWGSAT